MKLIKLFDSTVVHIVLISELIPNLGWGVCVSLLSLSHFGNISDKPFVRTANSEFGEAKGMIGCLSIKKARIHQSTQNEQRPEKKLLFRRIPTLSGIVLFTTLYHLIVKTSLLSTFRSLLGCIYMYTLY